MVTRVDGNGRLVGITGVGIRVPERILTNAELEQMVETSDEWIVERTGIRERRIAAPEEASSDLAIPAARVALERAGADPSEIDLVIVATSTPDMVFPSTAVLVAQELGMPRAAAYDLLAACTGFVYALAQGHGSVSSGLARKALVVGVDVMSRITNWHDRGTCILFGDGAGAVVLEPVRDGGFVGFELGADGSAGDDLCVPAGGSRAPASRETVEGDLHTTRMNGSEIFRYATRVMVDSARAVLETCGADVADVDLYVAHQANKRIVDYAAEKLGLPPEKVFLNIERYGNTSAASIPICLAEAEDQGLLDAGTRVLMTGVGGGLTWGSAYTVWPGRNGA